MWLHAVTAVDSGTKALELLGLQANESSDYHPHDDTHHVLIHP